MDAIADRVREEFSNDEFSLEPMHYWRRLDLVCRHMARLKEAGAYEEALIAAFTSAKGNNRCYTIDAMEWMLRAADREKLRRAGEALPLPPGNYCVYRGVHGKGRARKVDGLSWTLSQDCACWFANRFNGESPAIFSAFVEAAAVYWFGDTVEQEVIVRPRVRKLFRLSPEEIAAGAARHSAAIERANQETMEDLKRSIWHSLPDAHLITTIR